MTTYCDSTIACHLSTSTCDIWQSQHLSQAIARVPDIAEKGSGVNFPVGFWSPEFQFYLNLTMQVQEQLLVQVANRNLSIDLLYRRYAAIYFSTVITHSASSRLRLYDCFKLANIAACHL